MKILLLLCMSGGMLYGQYIRRDVRITIMSQVRSDAPTLYTDSFVKRLKRKSKTTISVSQGTVIVMRYYADKHMSIMDTFDEHTGLRWGRRVVLFHYKRKK